eukprot:CAMPEP_0113668504 /NCGR_PEP_ID=MMETSP0038_2-20120614/4041_1 /TAXON_ID=2898 /ORGANISM="Cryptomonas paramecium" /LENGTH=364 /DNA_ID=CAMNT_0000584263 /DNA_START=142 /DNA_END=1233 /DNA_ORIENTATION=+ /assembly_acc=CAM_ASM_000170
MKEYEFKGGMEKIKQSQNNEIASALLYKAEHGDWKGVEKLLAEGADPLWINEHGHSSLHFACYHGHLKVVRTLLARGSTPILEQPTYVGTTCLFVACQFGQLDVVTELVQATGRTFLMQTHESAGTCLHVACAYGQMDVISYLMDVGGKELVRRTCADGSTCLHTACVHKHGKAVNFLLKTGDEWLLRKQNNNGLNCLHSAASEGAPSNIIKAIVKAGGPQMVEQQTFEGATGLVLACQNHNMEAVEFLAQNGGLPLMLIPSHAGNCLFVASQCGHEDVVRLLIRLGGQDLLFYPRPVGQMHAIHVACKNGHLGVAKALFEAGGEQVLMLEGLDGETCLHWAASSGSNDVVRYLLRVGGRRLAE